MPSHIHRLDSLIEVREFLAQESVTAEGNYRIRMDHSAGPLPTKPGSEDRKIFPDIYAEALKVTQEGNDEPYYLITNLMDHEFSSYLIAESFITKKEPSKLSKVSTTDPFGALNYEKKFSRAVEHNHIRNMLIKEEQMRGCIGIYQVEISNDTILPGLNPTPQGVMEAKMVINMNQPMFIIENDMDNYVRPDMVTIDFLANDPVLLKTITPHAEKVAEEEADSIEKERLAKENHDKFEERLFGHETKIRNKHIIDITYLNTSIGHIMDVPRELTQSNRVFRIPNLLNATTLSANVNKFEQKYGQKPEIAPNNELKLSDRLSDLNKQLELETFRNEHGFYLKAIEKNDKVIIEVYDKDDAILAHSIVDWNDKNEESVDFDTENDEQFDEKLPVFRLQTGESGQTFELGKNLEDEGALDDLWHYLPTLAFVATWEDLPSLDYAQIDKEDVFHIDDFDSALIMSELEGNEETIGLVSNAVKQLRGDLESKVEKEVVYDNEQVMGL